MPVYVTSYVWKEACLWNAKFIPTTTDQRIFELLEACYRGMGKALVTEPDRVMFKFKHWIWDRHRNRAKKQVLLKLGARLLLDPETEEPWLLIFHPTIDDKEVLDAPTTD